MKIIEYIYCFGISERLGNGDIFYNFTGLSGDDSKIFDLCKDECGKTFNLTRYDSDGNATSKTCSTFNYHVCSYSYFVSEKTGRYVFICSRLRENLDGIAIRGTTRDVTHGFIVDEFDGYAIDFIKAPLLSDKKRMEIPMENGEEKYGYDYLRQNRLEKLDYIDYPKSNTTEVIQNFLANKELVFKVLNALVCEKTQNDFRNRLYINCDATDKNEILELLSLALKIMPPKVANSFSFNIEIPSSNSNTDVTLFSTNDEKLIDACKSSKYYIHYNGQNKDACIFPDETNKIIDELATKENAFLIEFLKSEKLKMCENLSDFLDLARLYCLFDTNFDCNIDNQKQVLEQVNQYLDQLAENEEKFSKYGFTLQNNLTKTLDFIQSDTSISPESLYETISLLFKLKDDAFLKNVKTLLNYEKSNHALLKIFIKKYSSETPEGLRYYKYIIENCFEDFSDLAKFIIENHSDGFNEIINIVFSNKDNLLKTKIGFVIDIIDACDNSNSKDAYCKKLLEKINSNEPDPNTINSLIELINDDDSTETSQDLTDNYLDGFLSLPEDSSISLIIDKGHKVIDLVKNEDLNPDSRDYIKDKFANNLASFTDKIDEISDKEFLNFVYEILNYVPEHSDLDEKVKERIEVLNIVEQNEKYAEETKKIRIDSIARSLLRLRDKVIMSLLYKYIDDEAHINLVFEKHNVKKHSSVDPNFKVAVEELVEEFLTRKDESDKDRREYLRTRKLEFAKEVGEKVEEYHKRDYRVMAMDVSSGILQLVILAAIFAVISAALSYILFTKVNNGSYLVYDIIISGLTVISVVVLFAGNFKYRKFKNPFLKTLLEGLAVVAVMFGIAFGLGFIR